MCDNYIDDCMIDNNQLSDEINNDFSDSTINSMFDNQVLEYNGDVLCTAVDHGHLNIFHHNQLTGEDELIMDGKTVGHLEDNEMGGHDVYIGEKIEFRTTPNLLGGEDIFTADMNQIGISMDNHEGGLDYISTNGNPQDLAEYLDPLAHYKEFKTDKLDI